MSLYLECHITIEPVFDARRLEAAKLAELYGFKIAKLLLAKNQVESELSKHDTFMTGHSKHEDYTTLQSKMRALIEALQRHNFTVRRYKIESVVLDSRVDDKLKLLEV